MLSPPFLLKKKGPLFPTKKPSTPPSQYSEQVFRKETTEDGKRDARGGGGKGGELNLNAISPPLIFPLPLLPPPLFSLRGRQKKRRAKVTQRRRNREFKYLGKRGEGLLLPPPPPPLLTMYIQAASSSSLLLLFFLQPDLWCPPPPLSIYGPPPSSSFLQTDGRWVGEGCRGWAEQEEDEEEGASVAAGGSLR